MNACISYIKSKKDLYGQKNGIKPALSKRGRKELLIKRVSEKR